MIQKLKNLRKVKISKTSENFEKNIKNTSKILKITQKMYKLAQNWIFWKKSKVSKISPKMINWPDFLSKCQKMTLFNTIVWL